jgi:hypothetical protein
MKTQLRKTSRKNYLNNKKSQKNLKKYSRNKKINMMKGSARGLFKSAMNTITSAKERVQERVKGKLTDHITIPNSIFFLIPSDIKKIVGSIKYIIIDFEKPYNLNVIEENTFKNCTSLISITIPNTVLQFGNSAFNGCTNLQTIKFEENSMLNIIGMSAFSGCKSLVSIKIPQSVKDIANNAFKNCIKLETIEFEDYYYSIKYFMQ